MSDQEQNIYEVYTTDGKLLWIRSTDNAIRTYPNFDEIVTVNDYPMSSDGSDIIDWSLT
jgi:hypothetical protein